MNQFNNKERLIIMSEVKIKFEFTVSLIDAENIMALFQDRINSTNECILEEMRNVNSAEVIQAYKDQISCVRKLKQKVETSHTRV